MTKRGPNSLPTSNGNNIKTAFERAEHERRELEIKAIEKHLRENGGEETAASAQTDTKQSVVTPELSAVFREAPLQVTEKYSKITNPKKQERFVQNLMVAQQAQAERENRERDERKKKEEERKAVRKQGRKKSSGKNLSLDIQNRPKPRIKIKSTPEQIRVVPPDELAPPAQSELTATEVVSEPVPLAQQESVDIELVELKKAKKDLQAAMEEMKSAVQLEKAPANADRIKEIRERLAILDKEAANPADYPRNHDKLENEVLALEKELKELELAGRPIAEKSPVDKTIATAPTVEAAESPIVVDKEDAPPGINLGDRTPLEWREKLRALITSTKE